MSANPSPAVALRAFYAALESADLDAMRTLWSMSQEIVCVHPGWPALVGRDAVMESWRKIFSPGPRLRVQHEPVNIIQTPAHAVCVVRETLRPLAPQSTDCHHAVATNILMRERGGWRFVVHHASHSPTTPAVAPPPANLH